MKPIKYHPNLKIFSYYTPFQFENAKNAIDTKFMQSSLNISRLFNNSSSYAFKFIIKNDEIRFNKINNKA